MVLLHAYVLTGDFHLCGSAIVSMTLTEKECHNVTPVAVSGLRTWSTLGLGLGWIQASH